LKARNEDRNEERQKRIDVKRRNKENRKEWEKDIAEQKKGKNKLRYDKLGERK
jgi:hypothetical protein